MSWNFSFYAKDKPTALAVLAKMPAPGVVKEFIAAGIDGLRDESTGFGFDGVVSKGKIVAVKTCGHLASGELGNYEVSTNNTTVEWAYLSELTPPPSAD